MGNLPKTCFVIIGFGIKTDYQTGREIDLDKTFEYIIKPAFEELGYLCFRSCDISHSGVIDIPMYENILKADFVVADLSTLNANVLYELGIRHAVRKNTTLIIAERELKFPFDLSHINIDAYEHWGKGIDHGEVIRFKEYLQKKVRALEEKPTTDSPLYTLFPDLEIPKFTKIEIETIKENIKEDGSLSDLMTAAEEAKNNRDYVKAIKLLNEALSLKQDNILVTQRLALATYKSEMPNKTKSLYNALEILQSLNPSMTTDIETLGLCGAIYKRLYDIEKKPEQLKNSLWFYERGFYIAGDYYNGINLALLFDICAADEPDRFEALANHGNARRTRRRVEEICNEHIYSKTWAVRNDKEWILLTLAEIAFANGDLTAEDNYLTQVKDITKGTFSFDTYTTQRKKLADIRENFNMRHLTY